MTDPSLSLQSAIVLALKGNSGVTSLVSTRVYDAIPASPTFPYVTLGDSQVLPDKADCIDGTEISLQIDVWTRSIGYPETKRISAAIVGALDDQSIIVEGFDVIVFEIESVHYLRDIDGITRHGAITFRALVQSK